MEEPGPEDVVAQLREKGLRVTAPRLAVMAALAELPGHADVEAIAAAARRRIGALSTQAAYDILRALHDAGLVRRIEPAGSPARYETRVGDNHHHVVCRRAAPPGTSTARWERRPASARPRRPASRWTRPRSSSGDGAPIARTRRAHDRHTAADDPPGTPGRTTTRASGRSATRGPATLENYQFLEKISHFDRERIPERVVHARGFVAHGYFEAYGTIGDEPAVDVHPREALPGEGQAHRRSSIRFSTVDRRPRLLRGRPRPARLRGQVQHRGRQLGPRRQQPAGLLHPRRDQVPRRDPLPEAGSGHVPRRSRTASSTS